MVYARLSFVKLKPEVSLDEVREIWDESVIPAAKDQNGFVGGLLLVSEEADEGIAISLWDSKEDADAGEKSGYYKKQVRKFAAFLAAPPDRKYYNVNSNLVVVKELEAV
jgi:heme-degrading monooxygenase HmoA